MPMENRSHVDLALRCTEQDNGLNQSTPMPEIGASIFFTLDNFPAAMTLAMRQRLKLENSG